MGVLTYLHIAITDSPEAYINANLMSVLRPNSLKVGSTTVNLPRGSKIMEGISANDSGQILILHDHKYYIILSELNLDSMEEYNNLINLYKFEYVKGDIVGLPYIFSANSDEFLLLFTVDDNRKALKGINYYTIVIIPAKKLRFTITANDLDVYTALDLVKLFLYKNKSFAFKLNEEITQEYLRWKPLAK